MKWKLLMAMLAVCQMAMAGILTDSITTSGNVDLGGNSITNQSMPVGIAMTATSYYGLAWNPATKTSVQVTNNTCETISRTVFLTGNAATMQSQIDNAGRYIPLWSTLTFQVADGVHSMENSLYICGFYGGGELVICSSASDTATNMNQAATLDFGGYSAADGLFIADNYCYVFLRNLKIIANNTSSRVGVFVEQCPSTWIQYNYVLSTNGGASAVGIRATDGANVYSYRNEMWSNGKAIESSWGGTLVSRDDVGTNKVGYVADTGGTLHIWSLTGGGCGTTNATSGGLAVGATGTILP